MQDAYQEIAAVFCQDPGGRGLAGRVPLPDLMALADSLLAAERLLVLTGFTIPAMRIGETDGPGGAANLARVLTGLGKTVAVVTDPGSYALVQAACALYAPRARVRCVPLRQTADYCRGLLAGFAPSHVIALERPGKSDGHYHNMRGQVIDTFVADTDVLLAEFSGVTVAVGDGGNELGMGALRESITAASPTAAALCADVGADFPLVAGVSNWWGWGMTALLSLQVGRDLLPTDAAEEALLQAVVAAGAIDGITAQPELSVDNLSLEENLHILRQLRQIVQKDLTAKAT